MTPFSALRGCAIALLLAATPAASAAPTPARPSTAAGEQSASVVFDPPLDTPVRYRAEKVIVDARGTKRNWDVSTVSFAEAENGYRMTVQPEQSGSNTTDPLFLRIEAKLAELSRIPYVITLDDQGALTGIEHLDDYWAMIFAAFREAADEADAKAMPPEMKSAFTAIIANLEALPASSRLALMTENLAPIIEFANTTTTVGAPIHSQAEVASPLGGTVTEDVYVNLDRIEGDQALIRVHITLPDDQIKRLTKTYIDRLLSATGRALPYPEEEMRKLAYRFEIRAEYRISLSDGLLDSFASTETVGATLAGKEAEKPRVTSRKVERIE